MNIFTYAPDYRDWDNWTHHMFRIADPPPRLPSWQDYFETDDPNAFPAFLHYYEPELTRFSKELVRRYGLYDQLADVKMVCVECMLWLRTKYNPSKGNDFLDGIKLKLAGSVKRYAMTSLKGFSETSATHYYELRMKTYVDENPPCFGDGESILTLLYEAYNEANTMDDPQIKADFNELYRLMNGKPLREIDEIIYPVCKLCRDHERSGFVEGIKVGIRLRQELIGERSDTA